VVLGGCVGWPYAKRVVGEMREPRWWWSVKVDAGGSVSNGNLHFALRREAQAVHRDFFFGLLSSRLWRLCYDTL
jgi:hypothetical protein